jgi:single-strand DNA-binding protein
VFVGAAAQRWGVEVIDVKTDKASESAGGPVAVNEVRLVGRLSRDPEERVLPSGDAVWTFRLVVARPEGGRSRQSVDALECAVWGGRVRGSVATWAADDVVEVAGSLRRRFFSTGGGRASRVEVEVASGRLVRRAGVSRRAATG